MSNATRKLERQGDLYAVHVHTGERAPASTISSGKDHYAVKSKDGWWARKRVELAERKLQEKRDAEWRERVANGMEKSE